MGYDSDKVVQATGIAPSVCAQVFVNERLDTLCFLLALLTLLLIGQRTTFDSAWLEMPALGTSADFRPFIAVLLNGMET